MLPSFKEYCLNEGSNHHVICCLNGKYSTVEKMFDCDERTLSLSLDTSFPDLEPYSIFGMNSKPRNLTDIIKILNSNRKQNVPKFDDDCNAISIDLKHNIIFVTASTRQPFENFVLYSPKGINSNGIRIND